MARLAVALLLAWAAVSAQAKVASQKSCAAIHKAQPQMSFKRWRGPEVCASTIRTDEWYSSCVNDTDTSHTKATQTCAAYGARLCTTAGRRARVGCCCARPRAAQWSTGAKAGRGRERQFAPGHCALGLQALRGPPL